MWRYLRSAFFFWIGLIFAAVGTPFLIIAIYELSVERDILTHGVTDVATLVEKGHNSSRKSSSSYWLKYVFTDLQGREHIRSANVHWEQWRTFVDGDKLPIRYVPDNPSRNRLGGGLDHPWWLVPLLLGVFAVVFGGLGWSFIVVALRRIFRELALLRSGTITQGKITGFDIDAKVRINGRCPRFFNYCFTANGREYNGSSPDLPRKLEDAFSVGDAVRVAFDPSDPERSEADIFNLRRER